MAERVASLYAEIGADTSDLQRALAQGKTSVKGMEQALNKLDLASYEATQAAHKLAEAEHQLATNTDPTKQDELRGAVLKARVEADRAQAAVDKYGKELDSLGKSTAAAETQQVSLADRYKSFVKIGATVAATLYTIKKGYDATVGVTVEYNKQIREGMQVTGMTAEAFSRLVQVADDWEISAEQITTSLAMMRQRGLQPSIESLADLAEEYVSAGDTAAFAEKATLRLGRGWKELAPILSLGRRGLLDAAAAIDESLIATEDSIAASETYRLRLDALNDQILALKYNIGNVLIPELVNLLPVTKDVVDWTTLETKTQKGVERQYALVAGQLRDVTDLYRTLTPEQLAVLTATKDLTGALVEQEEILYDYRYVVTDVDHEASRAAQAVSNFAIGVDKSGEAADAAKGPVKGFLDGIDRDIASPIANFIKDLEWFQAGGGVIEQAFADIQKALDAHLITPEQADEFSKELLIAAKDVEVTLDPTKLKDAAADLEDTLGKAAARVAMEKIKGTDGIEGALQAVTGIQYYLDFQFRYSGTPPSAYTGGNTAVLPTGPNPRAAGGPVMAGMPYMVGERGPEMFVPSTAGNIIPNGAGGAGGMNVDITINAVPGMDVTAVANAVIARMQMIYRAYGAGGYARGM